MKAKKDRMIIVGNSRLPGELAERSGKVLDIVVEVSGGKVERAELLTESELLAELVSDILKGTVLIDPASVSAAIQEIESKVLYRGKRAVQAAFRDVVREYLQHIGGAVGTDSGRPAAVPAGKRIIVPKVIGGGPMIHDPNDADELDRTARQKANRL